MMINLQRRLLSRILANARSQWIRDPIAFAAKPTADSLFLRPALVASSLRNVQTKTHLDNTELPSKTEKDLNVETENNATYKAISNLKTSPRHDLALMFTCKVCDTRSLKMICRHSYENGVVVVRCSGCNNLHMIADRLGWFGEPGSVEDLLAERGEEIKKGSIDNLNLTPEDLAGVAALQKQIN